MKTCITCKYLTKQNYCRVLSDYTDQQIKNTAEGFGFIRIAAPNRYYCNNHREKEILKKN